MISLIGECLPTVICCLWNLQTIEVAFTITNCLQTNKVTPGPSELPPAHQSYLQIIRVTSEPSAVASGPSELPPDHHRLPPDHQSCLRTITSCLRTMYGENFRGVDTFNMESTPVNLDNLSCTLST